MSRQIPSDFVLERRQMSEQVKTCKISGCKNLIASRGWCEMHYARWHRYGDPNWSHESLAAARDYNGTAALRSSGPKKNALGRRAEINFESICKRNGRVVQYMGSRSHYDFLVDRKWKVEVKSANACMHEGLLHWEFRIHHHGEKNFEPHFYALRFERIPFVKFGIFALVAGPIRQTSYHVTMRHLVNGFAVRVEDFKQFVKFGTVPELRSGAR